MLGKALLWAVFDQEASALLLQATVARIKQAYGVLTGDEVTPATANPIRRAFLIVSGNEDRLHICEAFAEGDGGDDHNKQGGGALGNGSQALLLINESVQGVHASIRETRREVSELKMEYEMMRNNIYQALGHIRSGLNRLQRAPHRVGTGQGPVNIEADGGPRELITVGGAFLHSRPNTLGDLWQEYETGLNGNKAARLFTPVERGRCRKKYSRRNLVWQKICSLVRSGRCHQDAIDQLYQEYGTRCTVTQIINKISAENSRRKLNALAEVMVEERARVRRQRVE